MLGHKDKKSLAVAQEILNNVKCQGCALTPMQLIKLSYIAHGYMLGRYGKPLLNESVKAWQYGPVVPSVYAAVRQYKDTPVTEIDGASDVSLSDEEKLIIKQVVDKYANFDGIVLSTATHKTDTPWELTWRHSGQNASISNDMIRHFYVHEVIGRPSHSSL
jgi:uncharacterized phage-associated protein